MAETPAMRPDGTPEVTVELRDEWPVLSVLAGIVVGVLVVVVFDRFRRGTLLIAFSIMAASVLRLVLSDRAAGALRVRRKSVDVATSGCLGIALLIVALLAAAPN